MSRLNPKLLEGRVITRVEMNASTDGEGPYVKVMHRPEIHLDDGSVLRFLVEEHPEGAEYGVDIIRTLSKAPTPRAPSRAARRGR